MDPIADMRIPTELIQLLTPSQAWEYRLLPYKREGQSVHCYGEQGRDYTEIALEAEVLWGEALQIDPVSPELLQKGLTQYYHQGKTASPNAVAPAVGGPGFLRELIREAFANYASDIHFEPYEGRCRVRLRIDGKLIERYVIEKGGYAALVNQIKIMASLDISEKRLPQDGRIFFQQDEVKFDLRVSTLPTLYGEKVVLRLLTRHVELLDLKNLGFTPRQLEAYTGAVLLPHGLILISGPTGSGKSTTLYATLRRLNAEASNILTIEDPVEYTLEGVNQVQLKEEIGLTFTAALRTFLRQDPDIIMLGEIRDAETAGMAIRSSLTGHLIFSTIHTNSAWGSVARLIDMGVQPYLISNTLVMCMAQRLVRVLCPHCKKSMELSEAERRLLGGGLREAYVPVGCPHCYYTGYKGRKALYEVIPVGEELVGAIRRGQGDISDYLHRHDILTLGQAALRLVREGISSLEETLPMIQQPENYHGNFPGPAPARKRRPPNPSP